MLGMLDGCSISAVGIPVGKVDGSLNGDKLGIELNDGLADEYIDTIGAAVHSPIS